MADYTPALGPLPYTAQASRPAYFKGKLAFGGQQYDFGTGGAGRGSIPYGDYPVTPNAIGPWGQAHGAIGINNNAIPDSKIGATRQGIELHAGTNPDLITQGCMAIAGDQWPQFRAQVMDQIAKGEKLTLHVGPDGAGIMNGSGDSIAPTQTQPTYADLAKPPLTPGDAAPALPPGVNVGSPAAPVQPPQLAANGILGGGPGAAQPQQQAQQGAGGLLNMASLMGGDAGAKDDIPVPQMMPVPQMAQQKPDLSPLFAMLQQRQQQTPNWALANGWGATPGRALG